MGEVQVARRRRAARQPAAVGWPLSSSRLGRGMSPGRLGGQIQGSAMDETQYSPTRRMVGAGLVGAALGGMITPAQAQAARKTFLLVHGSSAGGWCYRRVAARLVRRGPQVFALA